MKLQVGDRIYQTNYNKITSVHLVERTTETIAFCNHEMRFKREYVDGGWIHQMGKSARWCDSLYSLETPELKEQLYKQTAISKIRGFKFEDLSVVQIMEIMEILKGKDKEIQA